MIAHHPSGNDQEEPGGDLESSSRVHAPPSPRRIALR
jgi:hypothetical protein